MDKNKQTQEFLDALQKISADRRHELLDKFQEFPELLEIASGLFAKKNKSRSTNDAALDASILKDEEKQIEEIFLEIEKI